MYKFDSLNKIRVILSTLNLIKYSCWCVFLYYQGMAISRAMEKNILVSQIVITLGIFLVTKFIVMLCDGIGQYVIEHYQNKDVLYNWHKKFTQKALRDNEEKYNLIHLKYFDYLPELFKAHCNTINNISIMVSTLICVGIVVVYTQFYYGLLSLIMIFTFNLIVKNIYVNKINATQEQISDNKTRISRWTMEHFKAYKDLYFNFSQEINMLINDSYNNMHIAKNKNTKYKFFRDFFHRVFVDIPLGMHVGVVIIGVYYSYLTVSQMFLWFGLQQFIINFSNSLVVSKVNSVKKKTFQNILADIDYEFMDVKAVAEQSELKDNNKKVIVKSQDDAFNAVSIQAGVYHVQGADNSEKTTLINTILGFERQLQVENFNELRQMLSSISSKNMRIIECDAVIFNGLNFNQQILGSQLAEKVIYRQLLFTKLKYLFSRELGLKLQEKFLALEDKFFEEELRDFSYSDRVIISLMRALAMWDTDVSVLVIDECFRLLDPEIKSLFFQCIEELSLFTAIFLSTRDMQHFSKIKDEIAS